MFSRKRPCFELTSNLWVPLQCPEVFEFFEDAFQLESLTPPWLKFRVLTPAPIEMRSGQLIDYRLSLHGLPIRWRTEITDYEPPFHFQDSQLRGPYRRWVHTHTFEEQAGGTSMTDRVEYAVTGGRLVHALFVKRDIQRIFEYRQQKLPRLLGLDPIECRIGEVSIRTLT